MESTTSISKGVFVFKNGFKPQKRAKNKKVIANNSNVHADQLWYKSYKELWNKIESKIQKVNNDIFSNILQNLLTCLKNCYLKSVNEIPVLALLTGINTPDNIEQFSTLSEEIKLDITPHVATLYGQDCTTVKSLVENIVSQFVNGEAEDEFDDEEENDKLKIRKSMCTFSYLESWYKEKYEQSPTKRRKVEQKLLVIIFPEFESFQENVIQDFILIASSCLNTIPIALVFGVATSLSVLHKTFSYQISSKLYIHAFNSHPSTEYLNNILNTVILSEKTPFHLGGKAFSLFIDVFLFYDLSVKGFVQNFKFTMLKHFSSNNYLSLCTTADKTSTILRQFTHEDFENIRRLMSFRKYVESQDFQARIDLLESDEYLKRALTDVLQDFHLYLFCFHVMLKCVGLLVDDLPRAPLGKQLREIYAIAVSKKLTETSEFKESLQLLNFLSKDELIIKISKICDIIKKICKNNDIPDLETVLGTLINYMIEIKEADFTYEELENKENKLDEKLDRAALKQKLLDMAKQNKRQNKYEKVREKCLKELTIIFDRYLEVPSSKPFHEIFFFNNVGAVKDHIVGSHRAAIHTALNNPQYYLQCDCCRVPNDSAILPGMPDICIIYKLHLECGKLINMYDWLQAFVTIVDPPKDEDEDERTVDPKLQARFTRAVAEMEFLGFIKTSKRKTDHVMRLTWGG